MSPKDDEIEIDLKDLSVCIIKKWKWIILGALAGFLMAFVYCMVSNTEETKEAKYQKCIAQRELLSAEDANVVETFYERYCAYENAQEILSDYFASSAYWDLDLEHCVNKKVEYYVSSYINNVSGALAPLSLHKEDYSDAAEIMGMNSINVRDLISFNTLTNDADENMYLDATREVTESHGSSQFIGSKDNRYNSIFAVTITARNNEECDKIDAVVEAALDREIRKLSTVDDTIELKRLGESYDELTSEYISNQQGILINRQTGIVTMMDSLDKTIDDTFSEEQKNYFNSLKDYEREQKEKKSNLKIYGVGAAGGIFFVMGVVMFFYLFDDTIKTESEIKNSEILATLSSKNCAKDCDILTSEMSIIMQDTTDTNCLLLCAGEKDKELVSAIAENLKKKKIECQCGNPMENITVLEMMKDKSAVIIFIHLKSTKRRWLRRLISLCERRKQAIQGFVIIE